MELLVFLLFFISQKLVLSQSDQYCVWKCVKDEEHYKELDPNISCDNMKPGVTYALAQLDTYVSKELDEMNETSETTQKVERARRLLPVSNCYMNASKHNIGELEMMKETIASAKNKKHLRDDIKDVNYLIRVTELSYEKATKLRDEVKNILDTLTKKLSNTPSNKAKKNSEGKKTKRTKLN